MEAGRELDAKIAEKVMGWKKLYHKDYPNSGDWHGLEWMWNGKEGALWMDAQKTPEYSTDIAAAWEVVERIQESGTKGFGVEWRSREKMWRAGAIDPGDHGEDEYYQHLAAWSETAPHAICLAALKAVNAL